MYNVENFVNKTLQNATCRNAAIKEKKSIIVDKNTGVHYLLYEYSGVSGLTVIVDKDGKPYISEQGE
jgi:hypothetical protein